MRRVNSLLLAVFFLSSLGAVEVVRGRMKITVDENKGYFTVSTTESMENPRWVPLWWLRDPSTTYFTLRIGNRVLPLSAGSQFQVAVNVETNGVLLTWKGALVEINQRLEFLTSAQSSVSDGIRMNVEVKNLTESSMNFDLRLLLDTYLGEQRNHFLVNNVPQNKEFRIVGRSFSSWISPRSTENPTIGLLFWLGDGVTTPTRTHFANWKRLRDSQWETAFGEGRDFNAAYSYNDSAAAVYYEGLTVPANSAQTIVLAFANMSAKSLETARIGTESAYSDILESTVQAGQSVQDILVLLRRDKDVVNDLLRRIDQGILNVRTFSDEDLATLQRILQELESRKNVFD